MRPPDAVIDLTMLAELMALADGDDGFVDDLFDTYRQQAAEITETLRAAIAAGDRVAAGAAAHLLCGASLSVGAASVAAVCRAIEHSVKTTDAVLSPSVVAEVGLELERQEEALRQFRAAVR